MSVKGSVSFPDAMSYDPDLNRNTKNYRDNHKHRYAVEIILHFINIKY